MEHELTDEEKKAIKALERVAKIWPESLWLFSAAGTLCVMKNGDGGHLETESGGMDQEYVVTTINIENDGGDW